MFLLALSGLVGLAFSRSVPVEEPQQGPAVGEAIDTGLFYDSYLQEVIKTLDKDPAFREKMQNVNLDEVKIATFSKELNNVAKHVRDELDVLKRKEVDRIRKLLKMKATMEKGKQVNQRAIVEAAAGHFDHFNPESFSPKDLEKLIGTATADLQNYDEKRHKEFIEYEIQKQLDLEEKMAKMDEAQKAALLEEQKQKRKRHNDHQKIPHPGSKKQLQEVWEEEDRMAGQAFDPRTFFLLHDVNGDMYIDPYELEAIFQAELDKVYDPNNPDDDIREMEEERARMREHVMKEVDVNEDGAISLKEFMDYTNSMEFVKPTNTYHMIDEMIEKGEVYTSQELKEYKERVAAHEAELKQRLANLKEEALKLANQKKQFVDAKAKAQELNDPMIDQAIKKTENDLNQRELGLMAKHADAVEMGKETLAMKQDLAKKQIEAYMTDADMEEMRIKYERLKEDVENMLKNKEGEYEEQIKAAKANMEKAQKEVREKLMAQQEEMAAKIRAAQEARDIAGQTDQQL
ncbi:Oidioi.mRNA.OKI2018_I69.XSR.g16058.t1.cds [Oikopleura dioica]|uniref:Oidioi.mRNA.OKI2018_I69.XSR.g16058.t1.cds n=1 Tax=Oikopleura dioica TaxID=34765 RepID=A0ABN7SP65_OIKDI|nr:Oidioi.mRNA.OKI2018_I69.XSR.g16058.t1.cds [Oikopleura dioica]